MNGMDNKTTVPDVIRSAVALISTPGKWTTGRLARSEDGRACAARSGRASCFCAEGALDRAGGPDMCSRIVSAYRRRFRRRLYDDNDGPNGLELVSQRLLLLASEMDEGADP